MSVTKVILPKLGLTMDEGKILVWHKAEGDAVAAGDVLFETETDKATMEVEAAVGGFLRRILVPASDTLVPVTTVVALIADLLDEVLPALTSAGVESVADNSPAPAAGGTVAREAPAQLPPPGGGGSKPAGEPAKPDGLRRLGTSTPASSMSPVPSGTAPSLSSSSSSSASGDESRVRSSPAARKRAQELGVDVSSVTGSGPGGRVSLEDVEAVAAKAGGAPVGAKVSGASTAPTAAASAGVGGETRTPLTRMRRAIAERMITSVTRQPQYSISRDVDVTAANLVRTREGVSWHDVIIAATARSLRDHPRLRARIEGDAIVTSEQINIGVAVALADGLLVPVIHAADAKSLRDLAAARALVEAGAASGKLSAEALSGGVLTVSNLGTFGVDRFTAIVNPPECAILAVGRVSDRVVVHDGAPAVRAYVSLTLSVDHRVADGATAARFLSDIAERLERGDF